ncbi:MULTISPECIES: phage antirepressor KilAC domain-containing protein [Lysinibacillus]|uniref:phage antirepressor KilAC domain-containing protein n=1 Tax=Lysinibacillus TaxID=400634 RepID=UPI00214CBB79|nr:MULTISPECIES: phage antirepressor KilAC domain-containing protein [Lysinibacillus]UUV25854.1 phage antirepressor KilAC domain-containing protein [Lysinibacillus sp. FN11]UYB48728.1 phage antirepressor KilAC domain-containing protein [Lysinibacillus capsici]
MKSVELFQSGIVKSKDREFTRLVGGFGNDSPIITTKQIAELMGYENSIVNRTIKRNFDSFEENVDILDLKSAMPEWQNEIGYTKNAYNASKNVYILSKSGFLLYLKFAEGDKAVEIYKDFLEDYFQTKAENEHMKSGIQEQIEKWKEKKAFAFGMSIMSQSDDDKVKYLNEVEEANAQILELEKIVSKEEVVKSLQSKIHMSELIENTDGHFDIGNFAKIIGVEGLGRNNLFKWLREQKILQSNNIPYQKYMDYFKVIPVVNQFGKTNDKPLLKSKGVDFLVKRLIKDDKIVTKSVSQILNELPQAN